MTATKPLLLLFAVLGGLLAAVVGAWAQHASGAPISRILGTAGAAFATTATLVLAALVFISD